MRDISDKTRESRVKQFIAKYKFLSDKKYYKTNKVSVAAWDSFAARGQAGGCVLCPAKHHIYTIHNKRYTTTHKTDKGREWHWQKVGGYLCESCFAELEKQCDYEFKKW